MRSLLSKENENDLLKNSQHFDLQGDNENNDEEDESDDIYRNDEVKKITSSGCSLKCYGVIFGRFLKSPLFLTINIFVYL